MIRILQFVQLAALAALALTLASCGGGGGDNETPRSVFPSGGLREADGTMTYCRDFQLVRWGFLRFHNDTWGNGYPFHAPPDLVPIPESDYEQCILAREGGAGMEFGWRLDWPLDRGHVKGYPEVHYGMHWHYGYGKSTAPDVPIRIADIEEMTVRYDVDVAAEGIYNLAFDLFLSPDASGTETTHEIMVWVDMTSGLYGVTPQYAKNDGTIVDSVDGHVTIDGMDYDFHRQDEFDPYGPIRSAGDNPGWTSSIQQFVPADCPCPANRYSGTLDLAAFFDWLVDEGHVDPSSWVRVIRFVNEVILGAGETWLREYEVTVRGK